MILICLILHVFVADYSFSAKIVGLRAKLRCSPVFVGQFEDFRGQILIFPGIKEALNVSENFTTTFVAITFRTTLLFAIRRPFSHNDVRIDPVQRLSLIDSKHYIIIISKGIFGIQSIFQAM